MFGIMFAVCVSIGIPLIIFLYVCFKKSYVPFLLGALAFIISQVLIRIPLLESLQTHNTTFAMFSTVRPVLFAIVIGLSAGIFEELARFVLMRFVMKQRDWWSGLLFGVGHGGIEAILLVGINALVLLFSLQASAHNIDFFIGGIERLFTLVLHIGLSIIVLRGVVQSRFSYVVLAILIHSFVDTLVGIFPLFMSSNAALIAIEISLIMIALAVMSYSLSIKRKGVLQ